METLTPTNETIHSPIHQPNIDQTKPYIEPEQPYPEPDANLTQKQLNFIYCYIKTGNGTRSALQAGYSQKSASSIAYEQLKKPQVQSYIAKINKAASGDAISTIGERKERLTEIHRARVSDFVETKKGTAVIKIDLSECNNAAIKNVHTKRIITGKGDQATEMELTNLTLHDPVVAIQELNRMEQVYETGTKVNVPIQINYVEATPENAKKLQRQMMEGRES